MPHASPSGTDVLLTNPCTRARTWQGKPPPPHVPKISSDTDMSNFDEMEEGAGVPQDPTWAQPVNPQEQALFMAW